MGISRLILAYGFEYDKIIMNDHKCYICKSINNPKMPFYCYPMIKDIYIMDMIYKVKKIGMEKEKYLSLIDKLAKERNIRPRWQLVIYDTDYEHYIHGIQGKKFNYDIELKK